MSLFFFPSFFVTRMVHSYRIVCPPGGGGLDFGVSSLERGRALGNLFKIRSLCTGEGNGAGGGGRVFFTRNSGGGSLSLFSTKITRNSNSGSGGSRSLVLSNTHKHFGGHSGRVRTREKCLVHTLKIAVGDKHRSVFLPASGNHFFSHKNQNV